jgi:hypothetical protein
VRQKLEQALRKLALNAVAIKRIRGLLDNLREALRVAKLLDDLQGLEHKERKTLYRNQVINTRTATVLRRIAERFPGRPLLILICCV